MEREEELKELQKMVTEAAEGIENRLADKLRETIEGTNAKIDLSVSAAAELQNKAKVAFEALPNLIQEHVESQLKTNLTGIVEQVGKQFEGKMKAAAGGDNSPGAGAGLSMESLLAHSDQIIGVINAWKQPTTEQAMIGQMNFVMKWHSLLSKLEKGGGSGEEFTKAIADTFTQKEG